MLGGLRARRVAITADRDGPLLLRLGDELVALDADGALLTGPNNQRRVVHGDRATFRAAPGPHWLEDDQTAVLAISG